MIIFRQKAIFVSHAEGVMMLDLLRIQSSMLSPCWGVLLRKNARRILRSHGKVARSRGEEFVVDRCRRVVVLAQLVDEEHRLAHIGHE